MLQCRFPIDKSDHMRHTYLTKCDPVVGIPNLTCNYDCQIKLELGLIGFAAAHHIKSCHVLKPKLMRCKIYKRKTLFLLYDLFNSTPDCIDVGYKVY